MTKYIDAEKLKAEIEKRKTKAEAERVLYPKTILSAKNFLLINDYVELLSFIDSLQQEQPECSSNLVDADTVREDFITEVYRVLDADPTNDRANAIINAFDSLPTVSQDQPEVDLEKFISDFIDKKDSENQGRWYEEDIIEAMKSSFALGLNARKV